MIAITAYDTKKRKMVQVGLYNTKCRTFFKKVTARHYMVKKKGYGISLDAMEQLYQVNCKFINIISKKHIYKVPFIQWYRIAMIENCGHGLQYFLAISQMEVINK